MSEIDLAPDSGSPFTHIRAIIDHWESASHEGDGAAEGETTSGTVTIPDLYSFYGELCALRQEMRRGMKRQQEVSVRFSEAIERIEPALCTLASGENGSAGTNKNAALAMAEVAIRLERFSTALSLKPEKKIVGNYAVWADYAKSLQHAFGIIYDHFSTTLGALDISRIPTTGERYNPLTMVAVAVDESGEKPDETVVEEITPGFIIGDQVLKTAEVRVAKIAKGNR